MLAAMRAQTRDVRSLWARRPAGASQRARIIPFPRQLESRWLQRVAVFDDDVRFIRFVERVLGLARVDAVPITTIDPLEAVRVAADSGCDAVLVDLRMYDDPVAGFGFVGALRDDPRTRNLPVCLVTGEVTELRRQRELIDRYGCSVLPKPFTPDDLLGVLGLVPGLPQPPHPAFARKAGLLEA